MRYLAPDVVRSTHALAGTRYSDTPAFDSVPVIPVAGTMPSNSTSIASMRWA